MQKGRGGLGSALVVGLVSIGLILGILSISLVEVNPPQSTSALDTLPPAVLEPATATETPASPISPTASVEALTPSLTTTSTQTFLIPVFSSTPLRTSAPCVPGASGWTKNYIVRAGDNLFRIAVNHYTTLDLMRKVNCRTSDTIFVGEVLWVPNIAATRSADTPTPEPVMTATPHPTDPLTETPLPFTATYMPTSSPASGLPEGPSLAHDPAGLQ